MVLVVTEREGLGSVELGVALRALADLLAGELESGVACVKCGGSVSSPTAPLAKQLRDTLTQLSTLAKPEGSRSDELKRKRVERQAGVAKRAKSG